MRTCAGGGSSRPCSISLTCSLLISDQREPTEAGVRGHSTKPSAGELDLTILGWVQHRTLGSCTVTRRETDTQHTDWVHLNSGDKLFVKSILTCTEGRVATPRSIGLTCSYCHAHKVEPSVTHIGGCVPEVHTSCLYVTIGRCIQTGALSN